MLRLLFAAAFVLAVFGPEAACRAAERPNVVFILADENNCQSHEIASSPQKGLEFQRYLCSIASRGSRRFPLFHGDLLHTATCDELEPAANFIAVAESRRKLRLLGFFFVGLLAALPGPRGFNLMTRCDSTA